MTRPPPGLDATTLVSMMHRDKKAVDGLTFILDGPNGVEVVPGVDEVAVHSTLERFLA